MEFYKLEATSNDFIIIIKDSVESLDIKRLTDRNKGIGADGLINIDQYYNVTFFNKDGSKANMCGNGLRCVSKLLYDLTNKKLNTIYVDSKPILLEQNEMNYASINMPSPIMVKQDENYLVNVLNNHLLIFTSSCDDFSFTSSHIEYVNKNKCNITAIELIDRRNIKIKTYEYGVGPTKSCGSASIASFYALNMLDKVDDKINVNQKGGTLICKIKDNKYYLSGEVNFVFKGEIND